MSITPPDVLAEPSTRDEIDIAHDKDERLEAVTDMAKLCGFWFAIWLTSAVFVGNAIYNAFSSKNIAPMVFHIIVTIVTGFVVRHYEQKLEEVTDRDSNVL